MYFGIPILHSFLFCFCAKQINFCKFLLNYTRFAMKKMKNHRSVLQNLVELLVDLEESEREEFLKFSRRKSGKSDKKYVRLFKELLKLVSSGIGVEEIEGTGIREWSARNNLTTNFNDLVQVLYEKVIVFLGEEYKKQDQEKWKQDIEKGLSSVQALLERRLYSQAGVLMDRLERKIPSQPDNQYWRDFSVLVKFAYLRVQVAYKTDFIQSTAEDEFLSKLHNNSCPPRYNSDIYKSGDKILKRYADQLFFVKIYKESIAANHNWTKEKEVINSIIDSIPKRTQSNEKYDFKNVNRYFSSRPENYFEKTFWNLYAYGRALDYGMYDDALRYLSYLGSYHDPDETKNLMELSIAAWIGYLSGELNLVKLWNESQRPEGEVDLEKYIPFHFKLSQYTSDLIQYLPHRLELNRILLLMYQGDYDKAYTVITKMYQIKDLPLHISNRLKIMEIWNWMVQGHRNATERTKSLYNHFRNKKEYVFERAVASVLNKCSSRHQSSWQKQIEKECQKEFKAMKEHANPRDPLHHFFLIWIKEVLTGVYNSL